MNEIDKYILQFPKKTREILNNIRTCIKEAVPEAEEKLSYGMPTFYLEGNVVHFAAWKTHIGFYPQPQGIEEFAEELKQYDKSKGAVRFPIDEPIPYELIQRITVYRARQNILKKQ